MTIRLREDGRVIAKIALSIPDIPYQTLINLYLCDGVAQPRKNYHPMAKNFFKCCLIGRADGRRFGEVQDSADSFGFFKTAGR